MAIEIHSSAIVDKNAKIAEDVYIGPFCIVGENVELKTGVKLYANVTVMGHTTIGENTRVYPFAVLGTPAQHLKYMDNPAKLVIGKNNVIREHVTMHTGTPIEASTTIVGDDGLFMVAAHVAHDCVAHDEKAVGPFGTPCYEACAVGVFSHVCGVADVQRGRTGLEPYELPVEVQVIQQCLAAVERLVLGRALRVSGCGGKECEYYCQELFHFDRFLSSRCALRFKMVFFLFCIIVYLTFTWRRLWFFLCLWWKCGRFWR